MNNLNDVPELMTVTEAAKYLRIGRNTAYNLVDSGKLPSIRLGKQIRIYKDDLIDLLHSRYC